MSTAIKYRADIDGLRAFAILSVFIFHLNPSWLYGGFIGVDVFFVISGYLITRIIIRENQQGNFSFVNFYARRVKRIFPVLFFVLAAVAIMAVLSFPDVIYKTFVTTFKYASAQFSNFFFAKEVDYFAEGNELQPLLHTWSLAVEEQFYLVWPLLIFLCYKLAKTEKRNAILFVFFAVMSLSFFTGYVLAYEAPQYAFYMFFSRAWEFCIGGIFALDLIPNIKNKRANNLTAVFGFVLMIASFIFIREGVDFVKGAVIVPVVGAGLIIYTAQQDETWISRMLSLKPIVFVGLISYSMYLWHWPVIIFYKELFEVKELSYGVSLILVAITVILSLISYYLVEQPARKLKLKNITTLLLGFLFIGLFIASGLWLKEQANAQWRFKNSHYKVAENAEDSFNTQMCWEFNDEKERKLGFEECTYGPNKNAPEVLLIGDSHARHYRDMVHLWAQEQGVTIRMIGYPACIVAFDEKGNSLSLNTFPSESCRKFNKYIFRHLEEKGSSYKLIIWTGKADHFMTNARKRKYYEKMVPTIIEYLQKKNKKVILLSQVYPFNKEDNPVKCVEPTPLLKKNKSKNCNLDIRTKHGESRMKDLDKIYQEITKKYNVKVFDPKLFLPKTIIDGNFVLYRDFHHISGYGSRYLAPYFIEFMEKEFGDKFNSEDESKKEGN